MAATWVSKIGCGMSCAWFQMISRSCRAAWNTFTTRSFAISCEEGLERDAGAQGIDQRLVLGAGELDQAQPAASRSARE